MEREKVIKGLECCKKKVCIFKDTEKECPYWELCGEYEGAFEDCTTALAKDAFAMLQAQEPRVHGRWEEVDDGWGEWYYRCSACGCEWFLEDGTPAENGMNYCPRCGAKMDGLMS